MAASSSVTRLLAAAWRCCTARNEAVFSLLSVRPHTTTFTDSGIPRSVIRLMMLTAINASRF